MVTVKPLLSAAGTTEMAFLLTDPVCLRECLLVKFMGSVENGFGQFLFFKRKAELLRVIAQAMSVDIFPEIHEFHTLILRDLCKVFNTIKLCDEEDGIITRSLKPPNSKLDALLMD